MSRTRQRLRRCHELVITSQNGDEFVLVSRALAYAIGGRLLLVEMQFVRGNSMNLFVRPSLNGSCVTVEAVGLKARRRASRIVSCFIFNRVDTASGVLGCDRHYLEQ